MNKILIKKYYEIGIYKEKDLDIFVKSRDITEKEKQEIIGGVSNENRN